MLYTHWVHSPFHCYYSGGTHTERDHSQLLTRSPEAAIWHSSHKHGIGVALEHFLQSCNYIHAAKLFWKTPGFLGSHLFVLEAEQ